jgi:hypothetical protein
MSATEVLRVSTETGFRLSVEGANLFLLYISRPSVSHLRETDLYLARLSR